MRLRPHGPRLIGSLASTTTIKAVAPLRPLQVVEERNGETNNDLYQFLSMCLIFLLSFTAAILAPTIVMAGSNNHSTIGRSFSLGGFLLSIFSVVAATFGPAGLENNGTILVALVLAGFGAMIGGIIGDTVRLW